MNILVLVCIAPSSPDVWPTTFSCRGLPTLNVISLFQWGTKLCSTLPTCACDHRIASRQKAGLSRDLFSHEPLSSATYCSMSENSSSICFLQFSNQGRLRPVLTPSWLDAELSALACELQLLLFIYIYCLSGNTLGILIYHSLSSIFSDFILSYFKKDVETSYSCILPSSVLFLSSILHLSIFLRCNSHTIIFTLSKYAS